MRESCLDPGVVDCFYALEKHSILHEVAGLSASRIDNPFGICMRV